ncbi:MAG: hypothetical protein U0804_28645 [Gemmataceae bacterium]
MATLFGGRACVDPAVLYQTCRDEGLPLDWWGKANLFRVPLGRGPGSGRVLLTLADLDALDLTADHTLSFDDDRTAAPPVRLQKITLLRAQCVTPGYRDDARAVYLCELADRRHLLAQVPLDRAFNVRDADGSGYLSESLNGTAAFTWQELVDALTDALSLDTLTLPFTPDGTPENLRYHAGWAWEALNDVLDRIACAVKYDPVADAFSVVRLGDATTTAAVALSAELGQADRDGLRVWDKYHVEPNRGRLPEKVRVLFPRRPVPTDGSSPWHSEDVTLTATAGVAAGTYVQLRDDLTAIGTGTPTNDAALVARAAERAADWRRKRIWYEKRVTLVYRDFRPAMVPGETLEQTALDDHGGPMTTVLESGPDGAMEGWEPWAPPVGADLVAETTACRSMLVGKGSDSVLTAAVALGVGKCSNVGPETVYGTYDAAVGTGYYGGWAFTPFTTRAGDTTLKVFLDAQNNPAATLTFDGGSAGTLTRPLTFEGCDSAGRMKFSGFDCLWCDGYWDGPCGENKFTVYVSCAGPLVCDPPVDIGPTVGFWYAGPGQPSIGSASSPLVLTYGYRPTPPTMTGAGWPTYADRKFWGAFLPSSPWTSNTDAAAGAWIVLVENTENSDGCLRLEAWTRLTATQAAVKSIEGRVTFVDLDGTSPVYPQAVNMDVPIGVLDEGWLVAATDTTTDAAVDPCGDPLLPPCSACYDGAGEPLEGHPDLSIDATGATNPLTWSATFNWWRTAADGGDPDRYWRLSCSAGTWTLERMKSGVDEVVRTFTTTATSCRPFALVFDGSTGGFGDITVTLA